MSNELATTNAESLPADLMADLEQNQGAGMENADKDSFAKPMLSVLQKMSPQVDEDDPSYIEGAKPGKIYDNITQEVYTELQAIHGHPAALHSGYQTGRVHRTRYDSDEQQPDQALAEVDHADAVGQGHRIEW